MQAVLARQDTPKLHTDRVVCSCLIGLLRRRCWHRAASWPSRRQTSKATWMPSLRALESWLQRPLHRRLLRCASWRISCALHAFSCCLARLDASLTLSFKSDLDALATRMGELAAEATAQASAEVRSSVLCSVCMLVEQVHCVVCFTASPHSACT